ncbi:hypothetical protein K435DRAFT_969766 [Dendrothele bispora CBS 962.96]|uniref:Brl1/Brr6 domain-containing protein n=1 Tax=Dendrothele bispora (strain CBS 962.96) TaxID=1314807 RepID=A0A4S8LFL9_DENBC|nr:hypothetical protein K435DRAFT_969766 [Dendrothele bispora CBS 962.96]
MFRSRRSTEAPMDFQFTDRPSSHQNPIWRASSVPAEDDPSTPRKRSHDVLSPMTPSTPPTFGPNRNIPFMFSSPARSQSQPPAWVPPSNFSPVTSFPRPSSQIPEPNDVEMPDASPPKQTEEPMSPETPKPERRVVATGGLRRVYRARQRTRGSRLAAVRSGADSEDSDEYDQSDEEDGRQLQPISQNTSNHYTLNMPSSTPSRSDTPYILIGYLQFFFNLSLIMVFLYLLLQFILTVQRDVEHRVSEYSMDIVQEIARCALEYKNNACDTPIPAIITQCGNWETCMNRDPTKLGRARVGAELLAEVVNGFVEPISWKTLLFTLTSLSFLTVFINALLSLYRSRHKPSSTEGQSVPQHFPGLSTAPHPSHHFGGYLSPAPTPSWGRTWKGNEDDVQQTPTRRRKLESGESVKVK